MKKLPCELEKQLTNYIKWNTSQWYMQDLITAYIEKKNVKNETLKINMIMNDLWWARFSLENWNFTRASQELEFIKNTLLFIN